MTRWHGANIDMAFDALAFATARTALGIPIMVANSPYEMVLPYWTTDTRYVLSLQRVDKQVSPLLVV